MKKKYILTIIILTGFLLFSYSISGVSGIIGYVALFVIGLLIGFIIREIRNLRGGRRR